MEETLQGKGSESGGPSWKEGLKEASGQRENGIIKFRVADAGVADEPIY